MAPKGRSAVTVAGLLALTACAPFPPARLGAPAPPAALDAAEETVRAAREAVVAVSRAEGAGELELEVAPGRRLAFRRAGATVRASDGRAGAAIAVAPAAAQGIRYGDAVYPGTFRVEARAAGGLRLVNLAPLDEYVAGVVAAELSLWSALPAELEAQAIVARTYAVAQLAERPFLWDSTADQAYRGHFLPGAGAEARRVAARLASAVDASRGKVLVHAGRSVDARFHASCGGRTATLADVFPEAGWGTAAVPCLPCARRGAREREAQRFDPERPLGWSTTLSAEVLAGLARDLEVGARITRLEAVRKDDGGRWLAVRLTGPRGSVELDVKDLRARTGLPGGVVVRTWPRAGAPITGGLFVEGRGRGHGVGLCQEGCGDHARLGWPAERILAHYYPGARIGRTGAPRP